MFRRLLVAAILLFAATRAPLVRGADPPPAALAQRNGKTTTRTSAWQLWANIATVCVALLTALTLFLSMWFYNKAARREAEANTVAIMRNHLQIFWQNTELRDCASFAVTPKNEQCLSVAEDAVFTAETIIRLHSDEPAWVASAAGLVCEYQWWFNAGQFDRPKYYAAFVTFVDRELPRCRKTPTPWPPPPAQP